MTRQVETVAPDASLQQAAMTMEAMGVGSLPVCAARRLAGTLTDRDIAVRGVATGRSPVEMQVRRLAVLDKDKNLVGMVLLGDIATEPCAANLCELGEAIAEISQPSRPQK